MIIINEGDTNVFQYPDGSRQGIVVPVSGKVNSKGKAVMNKGAALSAKNLFPGIDAKLGCMLSSTGSHAYCLGMEKLHNQHGTVNTYIFSLPIKDVERRSSDVEVINRGCIELLGLVSQYGLESVYMPTPDYIGDEIKWYDIEFVLGNVLDHRFYVVLPTTYR